MTISVFDEIVAVPQNDLTVTMSNLKKPACAPSKVCICAYILLLSLTPVVLSQRGACAPQMTIYF